MAEDTVDEIAGRNGLRDELRQCFPQVDFPADEIEAEIRLSLRSSARSDSSGLNTGLPISSPDLPRDPIPWWKAAARVGLVAAASVLLFVGGVEYGRRTTPQLPGTFVLPVGDAVSLPLAIQSAGSFYVASLTRLSSDANALSSEERRVAREVGLAALYAASLELSRESIDDEDLRAMVEMVGEKRVDVARSANTTEF
jgi:hypothetical protein